MRHRFLWLGALAIVVAITLAARFDPVLIYNHSPSVPTGLYLRANAAPAPGAFVTVRAMAVSPDYAQARRFADSSDRFIKRVAAGAGATICARGNLVAIGATHTLPRASHDSAGRVLPSWTGCRVLGVDEVFLIGDTPDSFDSRYWGPISTAMIDGVWTPVRVRLGIRLPMESAPR